MTRRLQSLFAVLLLFLLIFAYPGGGARAEDGDQTFRLAVRTTSSLSSLQAEIFHQRGQWRLIELSGYDSLDAAVSAVEAVAPGADIVPERRYDLLAPEDEPLFDNQWHHRNTGQAGGTPGADIDSPTAWKKSLGSGVVIAVIDSGVDIDHPDLASRVLTNVSWDFVANNADPRPSGAGPFFGHGTEVAGVIVAAVNGEGLTGVAPSGRIMALRACDSFGCSSFHLWEAINYAVDKGGDIINLSLGGYFTEDLLVEDAIDHAENNGVLVVAAAGNDGYDIDNVPSSECSGETPCLMIPAGLPNSNILAVAASTRNDGLASFSNYGATSVDLTAPGVDIATTWVDAEYGFSTGTSLAAPVAAGVAALLMANDPAGPQEVIARLTAFVDPKPAFSTTVASGGRLSAGNALTKRFIDTSDSIFVNAIDWIAARQITRGCNPPFNHRYCPTSSVTRGEMAVFLSRALGLPATSTDYFTDDDGLFYEAAANRLREAEITQGCNPPTNNRFCGEHSMTRGEMAAFLARALGLPASSTDQFTDDNGHLFEGAINRIADAAITQGCNPPTNDRYCPDRNVSRGEMAAFIKRSLELP